MDDNLGAVGIASTSESMEDILQLSNRSSNRLKMYCRHTYQAWKLKNKGALLILVWNCLVMSVFHYLTTYPITFHPILYSINIYSITWGLTLPIAGWLADVYLKRYKMICDKKVCSTS